MGLVDEADGNIAVRLDLRLVHAPDAAGNRYASLAGKVGSLHHAPDFNVAGGNDLEPLTDSPVDQDGTDEVDVPDAVIHVSVHLKDGDHVELAALQDKVSVDKGKEMYAVLGSVGPGSCRQRPVLALFCLENKALDSDAVHTLGGRNFLG